MLLDSVLDENAVIYESVVDATDALTECLVNVEEAYGEMMLDQAKAEFKQYVNEGTIEPLSEGVMDSIKNFFKKLWNFIKKYWNKLKNWITGLHKNAYQYFAINKEKIRTGIASVTRFYGYEGLKSFANIEQMHNNIRNAVRKFINRDYGSITTKVASSDARNAVSTLKRADQNGATDDDKKNATEFAKQYKKDFIKVILGDASDSTEENFSGKIKEYIRGGEKETEISYTFPEVERVLAAESGVKTLGNAIKSQQDNTADLEKTAYTFQHQNNTNDNSSRVANLCTDMAKVLTTACSTADNLIGDVVSQTNRFAHAAVNGKSDDERKNESVDMTLDEAKAYLESIGLA